jgi:RNA polymerase sigma-70 factor (ECF subfamily)
VDEKELIRKAGQGDEEAFEQLVRQHQKMVYNLCLRMTGDREESFDLAQESFLKAWHAISLFQYDCKFTTWLCRITSNTCIDHLRKQKRKKQISLTQLDDEDTPYERLIADDSQDPALLLQRAEDHRQVQAVFARLPEQDRLILSLRAVEDMSYQEIGEALDLKPGTVRSRIARAREKVRRSLGGNFLTEFSSDKGKGGMRS